MIIGIPKEIKNNENPAKKGWATSVNYGYNLRNLYMNKLAQY